MVETVSMKNVSICPFFSFPVLLLKILIPFFLLILKNRTHSKADITLPTKVRLVKAMVFPVVMYGCESWTVKKAEH